MLRDVSQRTTLTLDDDVAARLAGEMRRTGRSYRAIVNDAIRRGLEVGIPDPAPFRVDAQPMGLRSGLSIDDVGGLIDLLDGAGHR